MEIRYEVLPEADAYLVKDLCDGLMAYQQSKAKVHRDFFDGMRFETRLLPSLKSADANFIAVAVDGTRIVGYAYSNIAPKRIYTTNYATLPCVSFFDFDAVKGESVGCLSQFFIAEAYRGRGIGRVLFDMSMTWLREQDAEDLFIFVSTGNDGALRFYLNRGFRVSHEILDGFITVLHAGKILPVLPQAPQSKI